MCGILVAPKYGDPKFDQKSHTEEEKENAGCGDTFCKPVLGMWGQVELPSQPTWWTWQAPEKP